MSRFIDHSGDVLSALREAKQAALTAMGTEAVGLIVNQMETGYEKRIWDTGTLQGDVSYKVNPDEKSVDVGNSKTYAIYVHEGFAGHPVYFEDIQGFSVVPGGHTAGRPYIRDALEGDNAATALKEVAAEALKTGFTNA